MADKTRQSIEADIISRALKEPSFKQQLLSNPSVAIAEIEKNSPQKLPADYKVQVLEETDKTFYVVIPYIPTGDSLSEYVPTGASLSKAEEIRQGIEGDIIARALKDPSFKQQLLSDPSVAMAEIEKNLQQKLPADYKVQVLEETDKKFCLIIPYVPTEDDTLSDDDLDAVAGGATLPCMFGSATVHLPY